MSFVWHARAMLCARSCHTSVAHCRLFHSTLPIKKCPKIWHKMLADNLKAPCCGPANCCITQNRAQSINDEGRVQPDWL